MLSTPLVSMPGATQATTVKVGRKSSTSNDVHLFADILRYGTRHRKVLRRTRGVRRERSLN